VPHKISFKTLQALIILLKIGKNAHEPPGFSPGLVIVSNVFGTGCVVCSPRENLQMTKEQNSWHQKLMEH
jgi:hypothetical protein